MIQTSVVTYARTTVELRLELVQGNHRETVTVFHVPGNDWAFFDPRTQRAEHTTGVTDEILDQFDPGPATLRATATGRPQWTRLPPPVVREVSVEIK